MPSLNLLFKIEKSQYEDQLQTDRRLIEAMWKQNLEWGFKQMSLTLFDYFDFIDRKHLYTKGNHHWYIDNFVVECFENGAYEVYQRYQNPQLRAIKDNEVVKQG